MRAEEVEPQRVVAIDRATARARGRLRARWGLRDRLSGDVLLARPPGVVTAHLIEELAPSHCDKPAEAILRRISGPGLERLEEG